MAYQFRLQEYKVLFYRIILVYLFYFLANILFTVYNYDLLGSPSIMEFFRLSYYGLAFDTSAILYVNLLVILLSILPLTINTSRVFQKIITVVYFSFNGIAYATNFIDFIYFKYNLTRSASNSLDTIQHESNKFTLLSNFLIHYWHVLFLFIICMWFWYFLYSKVKVKEFKAIKLVQYYVVSILVFLVFSTLIIGGIRGGDFEKSTRPINLVDANRHVKSNIQAAIVLNTPFSIIRTLFTNAIKKVKYLPKDTVSKYVEPYKEYNNRPASKPNIVIFLIESFGREYLGAFNKNTPIKDYKSYTPFIDSLAQHSLICTNAYANGYKSIHAMASVLAGIPSFKDAYTSTPYSNQKIESLVSILNDEGYATSFFHGAENGSMGFLGFSNILGIDKYVGREEYNNDEDYDGFWGIWDAPFLQFMKRNLDKEKQPFMSTVFTVSSHEPYNIPEKFQGKFPEGTIKIHKCVGYTDYAIQRFFAEAKKEPWYQNTIFVLVADHSNLINYPEYRKELNLNTVPILFYTPSEAFKGVINTEAQQIDIYPTLLDMIGYKKSFRSWGRSLLSTKEEPFIIRYSNVYYYFYKNYVLSFDGYKTVGFYELKDKAMQHNLVSDKNPLMYVMEKKCKAFIQDYSERIVDYKLAEKANL